MAVSVEAPRTRIVGLNPKKVSEDGEKEEVKCKKTKRSNTTNPTGKTGKAKRKNVKTNKDGDSFEAVTNKVGRMARTVGNISRNDSVREFADDVYSTVTLVQDGKAILDTILTKDQQKKVYGTCAKYAGEAIKFVAGLFAKKA